MTVTTADVSVIVTTYAERRWDCLVDALASLRRQTLAPREVIVVVDHNPKLLSRVRDEMGGVLAVESRHPPGLAGARNAGLAVARGTVVAFLDDDAEAWPDWLERLLSTYSDGRVEDVTHWAKFSTTDESVATVDDTGRLKDCETIRRCFQGDGDYTIHDFTIDNAPALTLFPLTVHFLTGCLCEGLVFDC